MLKNVNVDVAEAGGCCCGVKTMCYERVRKADVRDDGATGEECSC